MGLGYGNLKLNSERMMPCYIHSRQSQVAYYRQGNFNVRYSLLIYGFLTKEILQILEAGDFIMPPVRAKSREYFHLGEDLKILIIYPGYPQLCYLKYEKKDNKPYALQHT